MKRFSTKKLEPQQSFGEQLRAERERHGLDLRQISFKLKIPEKYLLALEEESLVNLPSGSYGKYFLSQYAKFLNLPVAKLVAEYEIRADYAGSGHSRVPSAKKKTSPWTIKHFVWWFIILMLVSYLGFEASRLFLPPSFVVNNPPANIEVQDFIIIVSGSTVAGASVTLNGASVPVGENGDFSQEVTLQPGLNTLIFTAQRSRSQPVIIQREVLVKPLPLEDNF